jgi:hypothetical protein
MATELLTETTLSNSNFLYTTGFKIVVNRKRFPNLEFFAQGVTHPSLDLSPTVQNFRGTDAYFPGDKLIYGDLTMEILIDEDMRVYQEIFDWMHQLVTTKINPNDTRYGSRDHAIYDISIIPLSSANNGVRNITYKGCFPISLGTVDFNANAGDAIPSITQVTFRFSQFTFE